MRLLFVFGLMLSACDSNNSSNNTGDGGDDLSGTADDGGGDMSGAITCGLVGEACAGNAACCSNNCDPAANICLNNMCKNTGDTCTQPTECCTLTCNSG